MASGDDITIIMYYYYYLKKKKITDLCCLTIKIKFSEKSLQDLGLVLLEEEDLCYQFLPFIYWRGRTVLVFICL